jgi:beta-D-xylosidase 4
MLRLCLVSLLVPVALLCALWEPAQAASGVTLSQIPRACADAAHAGLPFCNPSLPRDARVADLIARLSLHEKVLMLTARASPRGNVSALGLPEYNWGANCVHGVQSTCGTNCATNFPNPVNLGATFDPALVRDMGRVIGWELRALWLEGARENYPTGPHLGLDCWSPNININRDPRWGRNMETPGEDPLVVARYAVAYTRGLQEGKNESSPYLQAVVTLKHWAAYSYEHYDGIDRMQFDAKVGAYDFADTYLPAFRAAVEPPSNARGLMCSYNLVNGVPMCANPQLNTKLLRDTLGFDGYITSDSGAIEGIYAQAHYTKSLCEAGALAIRSGTDVNSGGVYEKCLESLVKDGKLDEKRDVDPAMRRTLELRFDLGLFDPIENQPYWHVPPSEVNTPQSQALSLDATRKSLVLLQNNGQALPLDKKFGKLAVLGPHAKARGGMMGNYYGQICHGDYHELGCVQTPVDAITDALKGTSTAVQYERGCGINDTSTDGFEVALAAAESSDAVVLFLGIDTSIEREAGDRENIDLPATQLELLRQVRRATSAKKTPVIVVLFNGGIIGCEELVRHADAVLEAFYPGFFGARAIAEVLFGDVNPSGKLPVTMYRSDYINAVSMKSMNMTKFPGRSYRYYKHVPVFPFGHGLSYTNFTLRNSQSSEEAAELVVTPAVGATLSIEVANTGARAGEEVVFAFFRALQTNVTGPATQLNEQLFDYTRVSLAAGEKRSLTFAVTPETLALHDEGGNLISFPGFYEVVVSNGVRERVTYAVHVVGEERVVRPFMSTSSAVSGVDTADKNPAVAMALATAFAENKVLEAAME